jgi:histidinol-phosphate aminotransferase
MAPRFVRADVRAMEGLSPSEQPPVGERVVKLNTTENPFPPSPRVMQALRELEPESLRRYPIAAAEAFAAAVARLHGVSSDMVLVGNGSDDILAVATRTFVPPGGTLAFPEPTYPLYPVLACLHGVKPASVPWDREWSLPIDGLIASKPDAIYVANPNTPTGTFVSPMKLSELAKGFDGALLIDEAYADFADDNCLGLLPQHENVVISRSLSKAYGLAGLRVGYAIAQPAVIAEMNKAKDRYNCDSVAAAAASAALDDQDYARRSWDHVRSERQRIASELTQMGWAVIPSQANFVMASPPSGRARDVSAGLRQQGILVRTFTTPGLTDKIRVTVGTSQENNAFLGGIRALTAAGKAA